MTRQNHRQTVFLKFFKFDFPFGDAEDVEYERDQHNRHLEKGVMSRNANREAVEHSRALNEGRAMAGQLLTTGEVYGHKPLLNSESLIDIEKREGEGVLDRLHYLDDHWEPVNATAPPMLVDPLAHTTRLGQVSATIVDFPISMAMDKHGQHKGNFDAQIAFARDRMKQSGAAMCRMLKAVFLDAQAHMLKKMYTKAVSEEVERRSAKASNSQPMSEEEMMQINLEFKVSFFVFFSESSLFFEKRTLKLSKNARRLCRQSKSRKCGRWLCSLARDTSSKWPISWAFPTSTWKPR